ncbi:alpha-1,2-fucosyltransferase [Spirosoma aerophilum]
MIISKITSGLGNQLFQYALARHLAIKNNTPLYLDLSFFDMENPNNTVRKFKLDQFSIDYKTISRTKSIYWSKATKLFPNRSLSPLFVWHKEPYHHYNDSVLATKAGCITLQGYWQSEKYFGAVADIIRQDLVFKANTDADFLRYKQAILASEMPVCVHIRRGDYVHHPEFSQTFGFIGLDYYQKGIEIMKNRYPNCAFFVFSDDKKWVNENFSFLENYTFVDNKGPNSDISDLQLMSLCRHNIIANSSYSWWGAWLNSNSEKLVIAPQRWYKNKPEIDTKDMIPASWLKL